MRAFGVVIVMWWYLCGAAHAQHAVAVEGTVVDPIGAAVAGAPVTLTTVDGSEVQAAATDADGEFTFGDVPPGAYLVHVELAGFMPFVTSPFRIATDAQPVRLPRIELTIKGFFTSVVVRTTEAVAEDQIKAQEQQRLAGIVPNFYVSYVPDAAPLTARQKLRLAAHQTFDWTSFVDASVAAAIDQSTNAHTGFGGGASGYGKRWAANFADNRTGDLLSHYVFAALFRQDPRYFYQGTGTIPSRLAHALSSVFVARSDRGTSMPNYAQIFGNIGAAALSNVYYPHSERGASLMVSNLAISLASRAAKAVTQEFLGKRLTTHVPAGD
jgi:hypothetical protein